MANLRLNKYEDSVAGFVKATAMEGGKQYLIYANMAEAYMGLAGEKTGAEQTAPMDKGLESFGKSIELALAKAKKFPESYRCRSYHYAGWENHSAAWHD